MGIWSDIFTWWNGATLSTKRYTAKKGDYVGEDDAGNRYYQDKSGAGPAGSPRRWVIYKGEADASKVPPEWYGWLHYIVDTPPTMEDYQARPWEKPHLPNQTGTPNAYRPPGSLAGQGRRPRTQGDYQPWQAE
jgi:NADH:ubiquinone oxidoreductase subunit